MAAGFRSLLAFWVGGGGLVRLVANPMLTTLCLSGEFDMAAALAGEYNMAMALTGEYNRVAALAGEYNMVTALSGEADTECEDA